LSFLFFAIIVARREIFILQGYYMSASKTKQNLNLSPAAYRFDGKLSLLQAVPLGLQHILAMFVGNLTPLIIVIGMCAGQNLDQVVLLQNAMFVAGVATIIQLFPIWRIGGRVPIVMGTSSGFLGVAKNISVTYGYGALMGASLIGGLFEAVLGFFIKPLRKIFPSIVTGVVVLTIGLSLISVGINSFGGGSSATDFGSWQNLTIAFIVLITIICVKHFTKGFLSSSSILIGIIVGYIASAIMQLCIPDASGSWIIDWTEVSSAAWFAVPKIMPVAMVFKWAAILPMLIMYIVTAVETVGDVSGVMEGGMGREATDRELSGSVIWDGLGSSFASLFGVMPNTSFSQNVGLVTMTKVVNRRAITCGAIFLILCAFFPKIGGVLSAMPQAVLGGAAIYMFSSIVVSGIQLITKEKMTARSITIVAVSLGVGYGMGANSTILQYMPELVQNIFGGSGIVPAAVVAIILNLCLPKDKPVVTGNENVEAKPAMTDGNVQLTVESAVVDETVANATANENGTPVDDNPEESKVMGKLHQWWNVFAAWVKNIFKKKDKKGE
jgi:NCS2 family nucleobase:cation symporter-2